LDIDAETGQFFICPDKMIGCASGYVKPELTTYGIRRGFVAGVEKKKHRTTKAPW